MFTTFRKYQLTCVFSSCLMLGSPALAVPTSQPAATAKEVRDSVEHDYANELPRIPPTLPDQALATFEVEPGFRIELVAAEPLVADPVAFDFDENGRLFVVEMRGYSEDGDKNMGQIRLLEDTDNNGQLDKSTVYADHLSWPTAVLYYDGGVFVGAAPDIYYLKDTNGDGQADLRRVVFTGFGRSNVQGLLNSFRWGLDNRIHVAVSTSGAALKPASDPDAKPLVLHGRDFSFNPRTLAFTPTSGGGQHGMSFNRWGDKFVCSNSNHIQQILIEDRYLARNPYVRLPAVRRGIAADGPAADVFRISPVEPWRIVRTRLRAKKIVPGGLEGGGKPAGYFTGATGITIYTGDVWPKAFHGNAFVGDVGGNLVHRKTLEQAEGPLYIARRATPGREFVASRDIWFRPVQFGNGPDGNFYIADMYREVIEHPESLPPVIKKHLDLTSGRGRGRIYRVLHDDARRTQPAPTQLAKATSAELVALLDHPNGWHRRTASRLLYERQDQLAIPLLVALSHAASHPEGRIQALYALAGMNALRGDVVVASLADPHPRVREHAIRLSEGLLTSSPRVVDALLEMTGDADDRVRIQLAWTLGATDDPRRLKAIEALVRRDPSGPYFLAAVYGSLSRDAEKAFHDFYQDDAFRGSRLGRRFLAELARQIGIRGNAAELAVVAKDLTSTDKDNQKLAVQLLLQMLQEAGSRAAKLRKQLATASVGKTEKMLASLLQQAADTAVNDGAAPAARAQAVQSLTMESYEQAEPILAELLEPQQPQAVQLAAIEALSKFNASGVPELLLSAWKGFSPAVRREASVATLSRGAWAKALVEAIRAGRLQANEIDAATSQRLTTHKDADIRDLAQQLLVVRTNGQRAKVVAAYLGALDLLGHPDRGREIFRKHCSVCHRRDNFGHEIGPDLATVINRGPEAMLISILDPNREVNPKYLQYIAVTVDGRSVTGVITSDTAAGITLSREEGKSETIPRADIDELQSTGVTLMPEGFEKELDQQAMADLIAYLRSGK